MTDMIEPRLELGALKPYLPLEEDAQVVLSANESSYNLPQTLVDEVKEKLGSFTFNRYPDALASGLRKQIATVYGVSADNVVLGNGSDELIQCLLLAYGACGRSVFTFEPTFSMYNIISQTVGTKVYRFERTDLFDVDVAKAIEAAKDFEPALIFLCSPNNPTGNPISNEDIESFLKQTGALIVIDEAYAEFSGQTVTSLINTYPNLVVLRTFSKAFSLAGLRIGYMLASSEVIKNVLKVKLPYNCDAFSQMVASLVLKRKDILKPQIEEIISERDRTFVELKEINGINPCPSAANFILIKTEKEASFVWKKLLEAGVLVRGFSEPRLRDYLRITIGTGEENDIVLKTLKGIVDGK